MIPAALQRRLWSRGIDPAAPPVPQSAAAFARILCLVEFSDVGYRAVQYADSLALRFGATLTLLYVAPAGELQLAMARPSVGRQLRFGGRDRAVRFSEASRPGESPAPELLRVARKESHDLIVLPARGQGSVRRLLPLRSTASAVLASAGCPVLAGAHFGFGARQNSPQPVLCSVDRSPDDRRTLAFAAGFARALGAPLALVHAAGDLPDSGLYDENWSLTPKGRIHDDLFRLQQECRTDGEILVESGPQHEAVARAADSIQAGLVIARRPPPRSFLDRLRAPVPETLWSSPCPVLHLV